MPRRAIRRTAVAPLFAAASMLGGYHVPTLPIGAAGRLQARRTYAGAQGEGTS
jgi:hypothetical protein